MLRRIAAPLAAVLMGIALPAFAADWTPADKGLAVTAAVATTMDWAQTRYIAENPARFRELNAVLGSHPSVGKVNGYFAGALVIGVALTLELPTPERRLFLGGAAALEVAVVGRNARLGIRLAF